MAATDTIGIALSGGGAKGDFEVGALRYLYDAGIRPDVVAGVSVGAVNAAALISVPPPAGAAEKDQALRKLEEIWHGLRDNTDMWVEEAWFTALQRALQDTLDFAIGSLNPLLPFHGLRTLVMLSHGPMATDAAALNAAPNAESLYNIGPIAARLRDPALLNPAWVAASGVAVRFGTVSLDTGKLRYVNERGELLERDGRTKVMGPPPSGIPAACQSVADALDTAREKVAGLQQDLKDAAAEQLATAPIMANLRKAQDAARGAADDLRACLAAAPGGPVPLRVSLDSGALASASIPMYFPTVRLGGDHYVNGGVREITPIQAALDAGATRVYAICPSKTGLTSDPAFSSPVWDKPRAVGNPRLVSLLMRTIDVWIDEVAVTDLEDRRAWPAQAVTVIAPTLTPELHDIMTIEPGMVDIAGAYGYMRAWDATAGAGRPDAATLSSLTDQIVNARKAAWELEFYANAHRQKPFVSRRDMTLVPSPDTGALTQLRTFKRRVAELVEQRLALGGAVPVGRGWWSEDWERHAWQPITGSPWDAFAFTNPPVGTGVPPIGAEPPAAAATAPDRLEVVGVGTDGSLYRRVAAGGAWTAGWEALHGSFTSAPAVCAWADNRLEVFGRGTDRALYHGSWRGATLVQGGWESLGGGLRSRPEVVAWGPSRLDIFAIGPERQLVHKAWDGSGWRPSQADWEDLGGALVAPPSVVAWGPNRLDVFVLGTDAGVYHKWWDGSAWGPSFTGWESFGGIFAHPPVAVSWAPGRLDVFAVALDGRLLHQAWDGRAWSGRWEDLGGVLTARPAAVASAPNRLDVFGRGLGAGMFHKAWDGNAWRPSLDGWEPLGGALTSAPAALAPASGRLEVYAFGTDRGVWRKVRDGATWRPSVDGWEGLGGAFPA